MHIPRRSHHWSCECGNPACHKHVTIPHGEAKAIMSNSQIVVVHGCECGAPVGATLAQHCETYDLYWPSYEGATDADDTEIVYPAA